MSGNPVLRHSGHRDTWRALAYDFFRILCSPHYADYGAKIRIRWWIKPPRRADALGLRDQVLCALKAELTRNGIDLPFPIQQVLFHDQTETADGDRRRQREGWPPTPGQDAGEQAAGESRAGHGRRADGPGVRGADGLTKH